jgi:enoyl-CoA hydratase/carnithine racemase
MDSNDTIEISATETRTESNEIVSTITISRPAKLNVLNWQAIRDLTEKILEVSATPDLRCVIVQGGGDKAFIGGADIKDMCDLDPDSARDFITSLHEACQALRDCPVPVIAKIRGYCLGGGMEVAAACDMRFASTGSTFGMPEVNVGVPSVIEAALLPRLIGWGKTNELLMTGKIISADEAHSIGFLENVVDESELDSAVHELTTGILGAAPMAIRAQKSLMRKWEHMTVDESIQAGIDAFAEAYSTDEPKVYMRRFLDR